MENRIYNETLSSARTHSLFVTLTIVCLSLSTWRWFVSGLSAWSVVLTIFFAFFLFYSLYYRALKIRITPETLQLTFGIITWKVAISNIKSCHIDETSMWRIGGAGIHFTWLKGKYRAFWNFLEYPRVVVSLNKKHGAVHEIAFSTKQPEQVMKIIQSRLS